MSFEIITQAMDISQVLQNASYSTIRTNDKDANNQLFVNLSLRSLSQMKHHFGPQKAKFGPCPLWSSTSSVFKV